LVPEKDWFAECVSPFAAVELELDAVAHLRVLQIAHDEGGSTTRPNIVIAFAGRSDGFVASRSTTT
jgi:hypothetical protein